MKILHVISSMNPAAGGPAEAVRQLGTALASAGHRFEVATLDPPEAPYLRQCSLSVHSLGPAMFKYSFSPRLIPWLRANRSKYDAVVVSGIWQFHSLGVWHVLHKSNTPYVLFTHGMLDPWFKKRYPLKHVKKWMYWPWADYRVLRDAQAVLFTSEEERRQARLSFWLYRCNEVVITYGTAKPSGEPGSDLQEFFGHYPELRGKKLALFMGRIHPKKGCDVLIEAFAKVLGQQFDWHLVIAGPDQVGWREELRARATALGLSGRMTWTGMLSGPTKWGALRAAEFFALPSHQENFGIAVAEALAAGAPVLISNKVNIWREIERDEAGMVSEDTVEGTSNLFQSYVALSAERKRAMREAATRCFERRFEIKGAAQTFQAVLAGVTGMNWQRQTI